MTSSVFCASCHEYHNGSGFAVLTTYSEWKNSVYAKEGKPGVKTCDTIDGITGALHLLGDDSGMRPRVQALPRRSEAIAGTGSALV